MKKFLCWYLFGHKWRTRDFKVVMAEIQVGRPTHIVECSRCGAFEP